MTPPTDQKQAGRSAATTLLETLKGRAYPRPDYGGTAAQTTVMVSVVPPGRANPACDGIDPTCPTYIFELWGHFLGWTQEPDDVITLLRLTWTAPGAIEKSLLNAQISTRRDPLPPLDPTNVTLGDLLGPLYSKD